ncbi:MAG: isoleucine--tRNA ligase [Candidatus Micrarchaeia archaeon]
MDTQEIELKMADFWEENKIFEKSVQQRPADKQYVFYDGPPFATGLPHYGHILGLTSKDLFPRYWTMKGYRCERRWGWDCHGLPIENIAEKELGIKKKKEIEVMGVDKFNEFCRSKVLFFANEWGKTVRRMGKWIEFENAYKTMDRDYMETVWYIFKYLYERGYIYEDKKILLYCPRCETPLSNAEIAMDNSYKDITERTITVKFRLKGEENTYILAWTTTPWTLIGNVALAINPKLKYVKVNAGRENYILAKELLEKVIEGNVTVIEEVDGEKLVGKEYEPLYKIDEQGKKAVYVIDGGDEVSALEGTGIVHMALYGDFDYRMIKKYDLPRVQHIGRDGKLISGPEQWLGKWFKDLDHEVIEDLDNRGLLFSVHDHTHSYPFCYRCETPLFYDAINSWFIDIQKIKARLIEKNKDINWYPEHIKEGRFRNILETAPDWSISRNRFWATAIPVWKCDNKACNSIKVIGSVKELQQNAIENVADDVDLHKHVVDNIHLKCDKCGNRMSRIPEVIDCWVESAAMPYAAKHYPFENKDWMEKNFPCDFVSEYVGQVRAWFYYMHVIGVLLMDKPPFKNVVVTGNILAEDGSKMSKSKKNFPDPNLIFDKYGADALRLYLMSSVTMQAQDLNFKEEALAEVYRKNVLLLTNVLNFYNLFSKKNAVLDDASSQNIMDRWIIARLHVLGKNATEALDRYDTVTYTKELGLFIEDLSTWYVRRSRERFKSADEKVSAEAIRTLAYVLHNLSRIMAPVAPFITEYVHQSLREANNALQESVHLELWPVLAEDKIDKELLTKMELTRQIVSKALEMREKAQIPIRQVIPLIKITSPRLGDEFLEIIRAEVNSKKIETAEGQEISVTLDTTLTPELVREGIARDAIRKINNFRKELNFTIDDRIILTVKTQNEEVVRSIKEHMKEIAEAVQADEILFGEVEGEAKEITLYSDKVVIGIQVVRD